MATQEHQDKGGKGQPGLGNSVSCLDQLRAIRLYSGSNGSAVIVTYCVVTGKQISVVTVMNSSVVIELANYSNAEMQKVIDFLSNDGTMGS